MRLKAEDMSRRLRVHVEREEFGRLHVPPCIRSFKKFIVCLASYPNPRNRKAFESLRLQLFSKEVQYMTIGHGSSAAHLKTFRVRATMHDSSEEEIRRLCCW